MENEAEIKQSIQKIVLAMARDPNNTENYHELARYYAMQENYDKVLSIYETLLEIDPNDEQALLNSGSIYYYDKEYRKALKFFEKACKQHASEGWKIENGVVTLAKRNTGEKISVKKEDMVEVVKNLIPQIHKEMYEKAYKYLLDHVTEVHNLEELNKALEKGGYAKMMWCGEEECENKIKELTTATARCMPFNQMAFDEVCPVCGKKAKKVVLFAKAY